MPFSVINTISNTSLKKPVKLPLVITTNPVLAASVVETNTVGLYTFISIYQTATVSLNQSRQVGIILTGGGGGGGWAFGSCGAGGGGGGAKTATVTFAANTTYTFTIGSGGIGEKKNVPGTAGGDTKLSGTGITTQTAGGGKCGNSGGGSAGGAGGTGTYVGGAGGKAASSLTTYGAVGTDATRVTTHPYNNGWLVGTGSGGGGGNSGTAAAYLTPINGGWWGGGKGGTSNTSPEDGNDLGGGGGGAGSLGYPLFYNLGPGGNGYAGGAYIWFLT
jgi:hypothetical protein